MNEKKVAKFKNIKLLPTHHTVDVWVCDDLDELSMLFSKRYGANKEHYESEVTPYQVAMITATKSSMGKGDTFIVCNMKDIDLSVLVHEIFHILCHLSGETGIEIGPKSQEWCAYFSEYLFNQMKDIKTYSDEMY